MKMTKVRTTMSDEPKVSRAKKKTKPAVNVVWNVGDTLMARWYHEDSLGSPFRGAYHVDNNNNNNS